MATSDAQKRAFKKYSKTEKGKEALNKGAKKYQATEQGQQKLKEAQARLEATEARKEYKRKWDRENRKRLRAEKKKAAQNDQ
jgi:DNA-binding PadR family transcriptional regulator